MSFRITNLRSGIIESSHAVSVAVCRPDGSLVAQSGDPERFTVMRSSAKPFQALPLVLDGVVDRFGITDQELALACASHSSERNQVELVAAWLERMGCVEGDLACGPHRPLSKELAVRDFDSPSEPDLLPPSPLTSNCSGKHTGMLALAKHHGWDIARYNERGHPVQSRCREEVARFCGVAEAEVGEAVDGCSAVTFAVPLRAMATAFAKLVASHDAGPKAIVHAMTTNPYLVGGEGRLCTAAMEAYPGKLLTKVGAEGVYGAALIDRQLGIAIKVEDGSARAATVALVALLDQLDLDPSPSSLLPRFASLPILNTRREQVGLMQAEGEVEFV